MKTYNSNGKLLLTGEYLVLDGALSLAIPTKYGQSLTVEPIDENKLIWKSLDENGEVWFEDTFSFEQIAFPFVQEYSQTLDSISEISKTLLKILFEAHQLNTSFLSKNIDSGLGFRITTQLDFSKHWGLGSSSTLINTIANWANVDAYKLLELTFGGSGYDIACAQRHSPITYQLKDNHQIINEVDFNPSFKEHMYFVYLNKKQNSREGISDYKASSSNISEHISKINSLTLDMISCKSLHDFDLLIDEHEQIISKIIKQRPVKDVLFKDFKGSIKSLGAWGGDFILVTSETNPTPYFSDKGYRIVIPYSKMAL